MDNYLYQFFLNEIRKRFSKKSIMVDTLANILRIEKGAVYRRLRQEVPFTFNEIIVISKHLNISLDSIIDINFQKSIPFNLRLPNFISPQKSDFFILNNYITLIRQLNQSENSEIACVSNVLPQDLSIGLHSLSLLYLFKWNFHYSNDKMIPFHQISIPEEMYRFLTEYALEMKKISKTYYVFDSKIFCLFVNDIIYFHSIRLINKVDVLKIKEDLLSMLDYLEKIAITGHFKETGNPVNLYISDIDITASYTYLEAKNFYYSMVKTFILTYVTSVDENTFDKMKKWIHSYIKISTLITLTNEKQRVLFFEKQRKIINEL